MDYFDPSNWHLDCTSTLDKQTIVDIRNHLVHKGYLFGLHAHFCGARGASPLAFDDPDEFEDYLAREARPGDKISLWGLPSSEPIFSRTAPNETGEVPIKGAY